jgi:hypothetical protein
MGDIPTLTKRRLQAAVIKPIYEEMAAVLGEETAQSILGNAIRKAAIARSGRVCWQGTRRQDQSALVYRSV